MEDVSSSLKTVNISFIYFLFDFPKRFMMGCKLECHILFHMVINIYYFHVTHRGTTYVEFCIFLFANSFTFSVRWNLHQLVVFTTCPYNFISSLGLTIKFCYFIKTTGLSASDDPIGLLKIICGSKITF